MRRATSSAAFGFALFASLGTGACDARHVLGRSRAGPGCGTFAAGDDLEVCSAGFVGAGEMPPSIAVGNDGSLTLGVTDLANFAEGLDDDDVTGGPAGVVRIDPRTRRVRSRVGLGQAIFDMQGSPDGAFMAALGAPWGVALLDGATGAARWRKPSAGSRVGVGTDGTVAVWDDVTAKVAVLDASGLQIGMVTSGAAQGSGDVAVDAGARLVVVAGARAGLPVLEAFTYEGELRWKAYDWLPSEAAAQQLTAQSRGVSVRVGSDDALYFLGESSGGNTVFGRDARVLSEAAPLVSYDPFTTAYNTNQPITFVARFRVSTGDLLVGQVLLARAQSGAPPKGASTRPVAITADERGHVLISGTHACCAPDAPKKRIGGTPLVASDADAFAVLLSPDFRTRTLWTTFGTGGTSAAGGVAMGAGLVAFTAMQSQDERARGSLIVKNPLVQGMGAEGTAYVAFWPAP